MARRDAHQALGLISGIGVSAYLAREEEPHHQIVEIVGGALAGAAGAVLPDNLEPPTSSWHRDVGHSWALGGGIVAGEKLIQDLQELCRGQANHCRAVYEAYPMGTAEDLAWRVGELVWRFAAGLVVGLPAGYVSHLALDACTPRGLPLLTR